MDLLRQNTLYRLYGPEDHPLRLGCGTIHYPVITPNWQRDIDTEDFSASLIIAGSMQYVEADGRTTLLGPGNVFQRVPGLIHSTAAESGMDFCEFFLLFPGEVYRHLLALGLVDAVPFYLLPITPALIEAFRNVRRTLASEESDWHPQTLLAMQACLMMIRRVNRREEKNEGWLRQARLCLQSNWNRPLPEISAELGIGYDTFRRRFREETGLTPGSFRTRERIARAMELLSCTSATGVAGALHYPDLYTFSRQFKQITGLNPKEYRHREIMAGHRGGS